MLTSYLLLVILTFKLLFVTLDYIMEVKTRHVIISLAFLLASWYAVLYMEDKIWILLKGAD